MRSAEALRIAVCWALALLLAAAGLFGVGLAYLRFTQRYGDAGLLAQYLFNALQQLLLFAAPALLILYARPARWQGFQDSLRPVDFHTASLTALLAVSATVVVSVVAAIWSQLTGLAGDSPPLPDPRNAAQWLLVLLAVAVIPPLCEELFFRVLLQGTLLRRLPRAGVWITALVFAALHFEPSALPALFMLGVVLGKIFRRHGCWASALAHALYNAAVLVLSVRGAKGIGLFTAAACAAAFVLSLRGLLKEEKEDEADGPGL